MSLQIQLGIETTSISGSNLTKHICKSAGSRRIDRKRTKDNSIATFSFSSSLFFLYSYPFFFRDAMLLPLLHSGIGMKIQSLFCVYATHETVVMK
mmetsp:Transcript_5938/g.8161  ORF Transcript_5938/g.8161 Transcript_5938/m.8161 type:complete len:95 (-) Transcript_5938:48-332(-)